MKAVLYESFQGQPTLTSVADPTPSAGGVVIRVHATGICRSDWHGWMGHDPAIRLPHVPGHELAGQVVAVGKQIRRWSIGDRVTVPFVGGCGTCAECESGNQQVCANQFQPGFTAWGSFAEFVAIDYADVNLVRLPPEMSYTTAASLGCRFVTAYRAIVDQGGVKEGQWVAIHGCGGVGLAAVMIAVAIGAQVFAVDIRHEALTMAKELGATSSLNAGDVADIPEAIKSVTMGGAQVSIDALGHPSTFQNSVACLRRRGRHVQVGLLTGTDSNQSVPVDQMIAHELEIVGSHGMQAHRYPSMLAMIKSGVLNPERLVTETISLTESIDALVNLDKKTTPGITVVNQVP